MVTQSRRRFTLLDAMVLVMATAAVLGAWRWYDFRAFYANLFHEISMSWSHGRSTRRAFHRIGHLVPYVIWPVQLYLSAWMFALLALRLVPPRPRLRRLVRQPGTIACGVVSLVLAVEVGLATALLLGVKAQDPLKLSAVQNAAIEATSGDAFRHLTPLAAWAVAISWLVLAAGGRWRPEPDWIDRTGRLFGAMWIATIPFYVWIIVTRI